MASSDAGLVRPGTTVGVRCGVRIALGGLRAPIAEAPVRRLIGHTRLGVSPAVAQMQLSKAGATALLHEDWNLDDLRDTLRAGYHPIGEWNVT